MAYGMTAREAPSSDMLRSLARRREAVATPSCGPRDAERLDDRCEAAATAPSMGRSDAHPSVKKKANPCRFPVLLTCVGGWQWQRGVE